MALLAQELGHVVHREAGLAGRARALPAAERLDARPGAGRRAGPPVDVQDAGLDPVEELLDLGRVLAVDPGGQPVDAVVREPDRLVERVDRGDRGERREQLVAEEAMARRQVPDDRRLDVEAAGERAVGQPLAAGEDGPVAAGLGDRGLVAVHRPLVDDRARASSPAGAGRRW